MASDGVLAMTKIGFGALAVVVAIAAAGSLVGTGVAQAAPPPITGSVSCALSGPVTFSPPLGYAPGLLGKHVGPNGNTKATIASSLTGCSGAQAGGNPKLPGPIDHGILRGKGLAVKHSCASFSTSGATIKTFTIGWYNATGTKIAVTKGGSGSLTVRGLGAGIPSSWPAQPPFPPTVPPGVITLQFSAVAAANSSAFPAQTTTWNGPVDQTIDGSFWLPCSYNGPPLNQGVGSFALTGVNGPATFSIGP